MGVHEDASALEVGSEDALWDLRGEGDHLRGHLEPAELDGAAGKLGSKLLWIGRADGVHDGRGIASKGGPDRRAGGFGDEVELGPVGSSIGDLAGVALVLEHRGEVLDRGLDVLAAGEHDAWHGPAEREISALACAADRFHDLACGGHLLFQGLVAQPGLGLGPELGVHRLAGRVEVLPDRLGGVRREGRQQPAAGGQHHGEHVVERPLLLVTRLPGTIPVEPEVPAGEVVEDEGPQRARSAVVGVRLHLLADLLDHAREPREDPAVQRARWSLTAPIRRAGFVAVQGHVLGGEVVDVPENVEHALGFPRALGAVAQIVPWGGWFEQAPARGVHAELADDLAWLDDVPDALAHGHAVLVVHEAVHDDLLVRDAVHGHDTGGELAVEPSPGLVEALDDEIAREPLVEGVLAAGVAEAGPGGHG